tara:strand:- start:200 stop:505 length:306 start_codon:yes stop_codon:yes gene_type:complete
MVKSDEESKGKMAMKVLDYQSAGLPCIATPSGLSSYVKDNDNILLSNEENEWIKKLTKLFDNKSLRKKLGENGFEMVKKHHSIEKSYIEFKELNNINTCVE